MQSFGHSCGFFDFGFFLSTSFPQFLISYKHKWKHTFQSEQKIPKQTIAQCGLTSTEIQAQRNLKAQTKGVVGINRCLHMKMCNHENV